MTEKTYNILFLCTGNSARSIMAEALCATLGKGRFHAFSAGSHPAGTVNRFAIEQLKGTRYPMDNLRSKSWQEYAQPGAPKMDFVITVCDSVAGAIVPHWPGQPISSHWGFADPVAFEGTDAEKQQYFAKIFHQIMRRMTIFVHLPLHMLDKHAIKHELDEIGQSPA
ncbi:arsenate reductase [Actimicrobium sp. GrIS 1.19]|uniref:arsenate reductase ArsC n=1 Tax=Actimicrobium sp. GrIS 1.19 TaxID=3071708 RepID=UPI002DF7A8F6|nr:arsenate reductase [Actimicrobium sp. GrIS 1.19]